MPSRAASAPPWFYITASVLVLWGLVGFGGFLADCMMTPESVLAMPAYDRSLYLSRPGWVTWIYGLATATGLAGSVGLLARRRLAEPLLIVSLVFVIVLFGWTLGATDLVAVKGLITAATLPAVIALIGGFEIWLARHARIHGWIA